MVDRRRTGARGELLAASLFVDRGFEIVGRNLRAGRGELDLVARRGSLLVFCEVRTRWTDAFVNPAETIDRRKAARVRRTAIEWLRKNPHRGPVRFDVVAIVLGASPPRVEYYEDAF